MLGVCPLIQSQQRDKRALLQVRHSVLVLPGLFLWYRRPYPELRISLSQDRCVPEPIRLFIVTRTRAPCRGRLCEMYHLRVYPSGTGQGKRLRALLWMGREHWLPNRLLLVTRVRHLSRLKLC